MNTSLQEKLDRLPNKPGVYIHKSAKDKALYVGKAKDLKKRVRSYFQKSRNHDGRLVLMISKVVDVEVIVTDTEAEALILENNLIKELRPRYNINLRDDKSYPFLCIKNEDFPRVFLTRKIIKDGSRYYGPYTSVKSMNLMLNTIRSIFSLRTCSLRLSEKNISARKFNTCLEFHIKRCAGPCVGLESKEKYDATIVQVEKLIQGKTVELVSLLESEMTDLSSALDFESAAKVRDQIRAIRKYSAKQKVVSNDGIDRDVFALSIDREFNLACGVVFNIREGKLINRSHRFVHRIKGVQDEIIMRGILEDHFVSSSFYPNEIYVSHQLDGEEALLELIQKESERRVKIYNPKKGDRASLMKMAIANADLLLGEYKIQLEKRDEGRVPQSLKDLQADLRLKELPLHIECFDISHLGGTGTVASCVVFKNGKAAKSEYRSFKIRSVDKPDDFQSMREVVFRRYRGQLEKEENLPDLIIIDGGKGQLSSAVTSLKKLEIYDQVVVVGLAKRMEEVFAPGDSDSVLIPKDSVALQLIQRIRDEAHRFAITLQKKQRKGILKSELHDIPGIGNKTAQKLLKHFGSVNKIRHSSKNELEEVVGEKVTQKIISYFIEKENNKEMIDQARNELGV